ncbi:MAG: WD40 repeat domain-containing protein, partial [Bacteroidales bacterium]|nr:WD40 repeat domain-containing protein [Bacteroidales bacterium]
MMAMSNLLAMKAKNVYDDKMMNLRLVMKAYNMAVDYKVDNSAELYDAMLFAMEQNGMIQSLKTTGQKIMKFTIDDADNVVCITQNAQILIYSQASGKSKEIKKLTKYESKTAVLNAIFLDPDNVIYSTADRNTYHLNIKTEERCKLSSNGEIAKAACITMDAKKIVVAYEGGRVVVLDIKEPNGRIISSLNLKTKLLGMCCSPNSNDVYILTARSELYKWSVKEGRQRMIFSNKEQHASCIVAIPDKRQAAVCFSNGNIEFVDMTTDTKADAMLGGHAEFQEAIYDTKTGYLMISSLDKRITVIKTRSPLEKPVVIEEHSLNRSEVLAIGLAGDKVLYALTADNDIRFFNLEVEDNVAEIEKMMPPPLKLEELELILGRDFLNNM